MEMTNNAIPSNTAFTDAGFKDIFVGSEVFRLLKIDSGTFKDPREFQKLRDVATFFNPYPDAHFVIDKALRRKGTSDVPPLDHIWSYVQLRKNYEETKNKMADLEKEISFYE